MQRRLVLGGILAAALGAGGIGLAAASSSGSASASPRAGAGGYGPYPTPSPTSTGAATVTTRSTPHGRVIADGAGRTLYLFEADSSTTSACDGACAAVWPPLTAVGAVQAGGGASTTLLGSIDRGDGTRQVTYDGHPLYYYAGDHEPGDTAGQGLKQFGAAWYVLDPAGAKIDDD